MQLSLGNHPSQVNNALTIHAEQQPSVDAKENSEDVPNAERVTQRNVVPCDGTTASGSRSEVSSRDTRQAQIETTMATESPAPRTPPVQERDKTSDAKEKVQEGLANGVHLAALYCRDVLRRAFERMKEPLSLFLVVLLSAWILSRMTPLVRMALSPLCVVPGISNSTLCLPVQSAPVPSVNFEKLVDIQGSTFERLVVESAGGSELSINVLKAEMATHDLSLLVRYSDLKSRDDIADTLRAIAADAKKTGRRLSKLNAKVVGAIDEMMALNNYAMVTIGDASRNAPSRLLQTISPIKLGPTSEEIVAEAYTMAMDESERVIQKLILEAEVSLRNLEQLEADIDTLQDMVTREGVHTAREKEKLFGALWSRVGGNREAKRGYSDRLALLNSLGEYGGLATKYVKGTLRALEAMRDELEDLRERVVTPGLLGNKIPIHVHMQSIRSGLERLQEGRLILRGRRIGEETVRALLNLNHGPD